MYWNANNLYGWSMSQKLPVNRFIWKFSNPADKYMVLEYLWNILMRHSPYIREKFSMKLQGIFRSNVLGILNTRISRNTIVVFSSG